MPEDGFSRSSFPVRERLDLCHTTINEQFDADNIAAVLGNELLSSGKIDATGATCNQRDFFQELL
ncbi:hypothetical protein A6770_23545 [Nostoc minutum NIES-26]|uniref:Uncharacterized protein n=1 Tax=Nostoc minutum NIES-26 TaxID=1844469 RepID=A0A367QZ09_9NOSO|nr:hypothetical protein A6770_23545 [Nostoc minutum NIES-26]